MRTLAVRYPHEPLTGPSTDTGKNRLNTLLSYRRRASGPSAMEIPDRLPPPTAASLRTTWLVTLLTARVPLPELLAAAGLAGTGTFIDLLPHAARRSLGLDGPVTYRMLRHAYTLLVRALDTGTRLTAHETGTTHTSTTDGTTAPTHAHIRTPTPRGKPTLRPTPVGQPARTPPPRLITAHPPDEIPNTQNNPQPGRIRAEGCVNLTWVFA
ncbi:hypothetical protein [Streptomyces qinzhouensis]|uniref:hypothetical protein n=1 Tax=Streptomyces qinzhouensis TaxID=2599401 RepID=UPI001FE42C2D|nr:hypothetical protein [Streptomyces qinzhouensis]